MKQIKLFDEEYLTILKASAGSGKTFRLARLYLQLLFTDFYYFRHILAVTFTNKATAELKQRILSELFKIAAEKGSDHFEYLCKECELNSTQLVGKAKRILQSLLQDYSNFHIYTIDGFFQYILKGFFKEIGLHNQYNVELNQDQILDKATDLVFFSLAENNDQNLIKWLTKYSETQIEEGQNWNLKNKVKLLGKELFSEQYKMFTPKNEELDKVLNDISGLQNFVRTQNKTFANRVSEMASDILKMVDSNGFGPDHFKGKSKSVLSLFNKIIKEKDKLKELPKLPKYMDAPEEVIPKTGKHVAELELFYHTHLNPSIKQLNSYLEEEFPLIVRNRLVNKNLYSFGVIKYIHQAIRLLNHEQSTILISDSNDLISQITQNTDAPFIFEKTGNKFRNYMIDEFQDTSRVQWKNLKPLLDNSVAQGDSNLIVGDVKQAIYRWRNSDWKMLGTEIANEFKNKGLNEESLPANYRSTKNIVDFNNAFFHAAKDVMIQQWQNEVVDHSELIEVAYANCFQQLGKNNEGGFVEGHLIEADNKEAYLERALEQSCTQLETLMAKGYRPSDICILVRKNDEGKKVVEYGQRHFQNTDVQFISEESFYLSSSYVVQFVISVLQYLRNPLPILLNEVYFVLKHYFKNNLEYASQKELKRDLEILQNLTSVKALSNLVHDIVIYFKLDDEEGQQAFLLALLDEIKGLQERGASGIEEFLKFWDIQKEKLVLKEIGSTNAIRVMSVHKSKGLEFNVVLVPFVEWSMVPSSQNAPIIWCANDFYPSKSIKVLPVKYCKDMAKSTFQDYYYMEKIQSSIDNLNLLYVAFTRACEGLIFNTFQLSGKSVSQSSTSGLIQNVLENASIGTSDDLIPLNDFWNDEERTFMLGEMNPEKKTKDVPVSSGIDLHISAPKGKVKVRKKAQAFALEQTKGISATRLGVHLHSFFENLDSIENIEKHWEKFKNEVHISDERFQSIRKQINEHVHTGEAARWFDVNNKALTEVDVLTKDGTLIRPDRVVELENRIDVVDFKFGKSKSQKHIEQVQNYCAVLSELFKKPLKGFVWYVMLGEVVEC